MYRVGPSASQNSGAADLSVSGISTQVLEYLLSIVRTIQEQHLDSESFFNFNFI